MENRTAGLLAAGAAALGALAGLIAAPRFIAVCPPCAPEGDPKFLEARGTQRRQILFDLVGQLAPDNNEWPRWSALQELPMRVLGSFDEWSFQRRIETLVNDRMTSNQLRIAFARQGFVYQSRAEWIEEAGSE